MSAHLSIGGIAQPLPFQQGDAPLATFVTGIRIAQFDALLATHLDFLSPQELEFFRARQFEKKQKSYLSGRFAAKLALSSLVTGKDWKEIDIYPGVFDQPLVRCPASPTPGVSITHCEDLAMALAFPLTHPMGLDVELIDPAMVETMKSQMTPAEKAWVQSDEPNRCALIWTAKEALSKAIKCGLTASFELLEVEELKPVGHGWQGTYRHFKQYRCHSWLGKQHALSLTVPMQLAPPEGTDLRTLLT